MSTSTTFALNGRLDGTTSTTTEKDLLALLSGDINTIDIDISNLDYLSSAGLRVLLVAAKGGKIVLHGPKPTILEVFKISGFDRIIAIAT